MQVGASTFLYAREDAVTAVSALADAGIKYIELTCDHPQADLPNLTANQVQQLLALKAEKSLVYSLHTPCYEANPASSSQRMRNIVLEGYLDTVVLANQLGADMVVVHTGHKSDGTKSKEEAMANALVVLTETVQFVRKYPGITLVMENTGFYSQNFLNSADDFLYLINVINSSQLKASIDIGHAVLQDLEPAALIRACREHLVHLHLQDNNGVFDDHLALGWGKINYSSIAQALREINFSGRAIIEIFSETPRSALKESVHFLRELGLI